MSTVVIQLKEQGNEEYRQGNYLKAAAIYSKAIKQEPGNAVLYSNRAAALIKLNKLGKAQSDAEQAIELDPKWDKGYLRAAAVAEAQERLDQALDMYKAAQKVRPDSRDIADKVRSLTRAVNGSKGSSNSSSKSTSKGTSSFSFSKSSSSDSRDQQRPAAAAAGAAAQKQQPETGVSHQQEQEQKQQQLPHAAREFQEWLLDYAQQKVKDDGQEFPPEVHFLPGHQYPSPEGEEAEAVRGTVAFNTPELLEGFVHFLREKGSGVEAVAAGLVVAKRTIAFPQVWTRPEWPHKDDDGVFVQIQALPASASKTPAAAAVTAAGGGGSDDVAAASSDLSDTSKEVDQPYQKYSSSSTAAPEVKDKSGSSSSSNSIERMWFIAAGGKTVRGVYEVDPSYALLPTILKVPES